MIRAVRISKSFEDKLVIDDVSVTFQPGEINQIIGQSGSGKTVLLKSLVGLYEVDKGEIFYDDFSFTKLQRNEKQEVREKIGMLFQGSALFDSATVIENVMFPLEMFTKMSKEEMEERANFCLQRVDIENANHLFPSEISGGMQKRVAIARAIALNPRYLFCDEPNSGLDPRTATVIDNLIKEITQEYQMTTIINTHDMNSIMEIGDKIFFINEGKIWWEGNREEILHADNKELNDFVFSSALTRAVKGVL
ncbi:ABC transporter ATP-binding protein [Williamwhitmania taraxaci]|uniref:Phospholipid/cholesterol/gamma-HCH transport system ATP-binding protein n=1 Tax=Williamwhitmania taraxaci TaxID=1640674 RepID=A0A1G6SMK6_9BACT|nr:ATP-binding cassette domain-containing protein [Williamwhitmania taraxaci]SDD18170.1 phospholipid/cholesterol/gamma-HCH transport system ATP-binding protein [Williamwhitmania taraxaci]